jgi:hypothetical protein
MFSPSYGKATLACKSPPTALFLRHGLAGILLLLAAFRLRCGPTTKLCGLETKDMSSVGLLDIIAGCG